MVRETCNCGRQTLLMTSWTDINPGRRFVRCPQYKESGGCKYWDWVDPEMCQRSKEIIPGLLRSKNKIAAEVETWKEMAKVQQGNARRLKMYLMLHWGVILLWLFFFKSGAKCENEIGEEADL